MQADVSLRRSVRQRHRPARDRQAAHHVAIGQRHHMLAFQMPKARDHRCRRAGIGQAAIDEKRIRYIGHHASMQPFDVSPPCAIDMPPHDKIWNVFRPFGNHRHIFEMRVVTFVLCPSPDFMFPHVGQRHQRAVVQHHPDHRIGSLSIGPSHDGPLFEQRPRKDRQVFPRKPVIRKFIGEVTHHPAARLSEHHRFTDRNRLHIRGTAIALIFHVDLGRSNRRSLPVTRHHPFSAGCQDHQAARCDHRPDFIYLLCLDPEDDRVTVFRRRRRPEVLI